MAVPSRHTSLSLSRRQLLGAGVASGLAGLAPGAFAQEWPARPVRMVVPFSAGGAADTSARAVGQRLSEALGQPLTIENRTGGNAVVAATPRLIALRAVHGEVYAAAPAAAHAADGTANGGAVVCANAAATWPVTAHVATTPPVQKSARRVSASLSGSTTTAG